jgi:tetratricopeptide (TPR) repeat protein
LPCSANRRAAARVSQNLGSLHMMRDAYAQAAPHFREAAVLFARLNDHAYSVLADIGLGDTLAAQGDFDEAALIYERARMRADNRALPLQRALVSESRALLDMARGRYREALAGFESARRQYAALSMPQYLAVAEKQLGDAYLELRLLPEALALLQAAEARFGELGLVVEQAWALLQRGRAQALLGQAGAAEACAAAARLFAEQGNAVGQAAVALARAELALANQDAPRALVWADEAEAAYQATGQADGLARAQEARGRALLADGRAAEAAEVFACTLAQARQQAQLQVQVRCLTGQGQTAFALGDEAAAKAAFESAIELFEDLRHALPGDDLRRAFLSDHLRPYEARVRMALSAGDPAEVLVCLDRCRARALDARLAEAGQDSEAADEATLLLRERQNWLARRLQRLHDEGGASAALAGERLRTERALLEQVRRQRLLQPPTVLGSASDLVRRGAQDVAALRAALQPGDALIEYGVLDDELFACVVSPQRITLHRRIGAWPEVLDAVRGLRFQIDSLRHGTSRLQAHMGTLVARSQARLVRLHALLWAPIAADLADARRLLIATPGALGLVPFAALPDGPAPAGDGPSGWLGSRCEIALVSSVRAALRGLLKPPVPARRVLAIGETSRLAHTSAEAAFVASLFAQGDHFVGEQATVACLHRHAASADVVHLACHAEFRADNPRFSGLHLHDGLLGVDAAEELRLKPCTVVLSACETGVGDIEAGDESVGLVRAFLVAGASRVLASQWPVDDAATGEFMAAFYTALAEGLSPARALGQAQALVRARHPHPALWAAFSLHGGW